MKNNTNAGKVIWSVEVNAEGKKLQFATFKALARLTENSGLSIEPVTVLSPDQLKIPHSAFHRHGDEIQLGAATLLKKWVKELKHPRLLPPKLLAQKSFSASQTIEELLKYATETGASLIGLGTHTKKSWERLLVGSFAETMILKSRVPLFVVNPKLVGSKKITKIFFPTDFAAGSEAAFDSLLTTAKNLKAKLVLYYKYEYLLPETYAAISTTPQYQQYFEADKKQHRELGKAWMAKANERGVKAELVLDEGTAYVTDGILAAAKKAKADMIAMASHTNLVEAVVLGSVTRQIVRSSPIPVWVIHTPGGRVDGLLPNTPEAKRTSARARA